MATEFYVNMQKRGDGEVYADLHKTTGNIYLGKEACQDEVDNSPLPEGRHVVKLIALTQEEYDDLVGNQRMFQDDQ